jgi:hypothetical protein
MSNIASPLRFAVAGAITLALLFAVCWLGAIVWPVGPTHLFVTLFTAEAVNSIPALLIGGCAAVFFGAVSGILLAWSYNLTSSFGRTSG